ncbi:MAG TPA: ankyrin repeat domain-containing protein [Candidatus Limnocylindrales bacterium]|nr:ankyrin repeat domain-containing protein [Candidatus Limnocylindrales bacterium]
MTPPPLAGLFSAIDRGDVPAVERILAAEPALAATHDDAGVSATMHALYHGHPAVARALAEVLPALDLFEAAALGRAERVRELLTEDPALARSVSPDGFTALHYPAFFGEGDAADCARLLLAAAADVNARSANDFSVLPLHSAVAGNHDDVVQVLLAAGADVNATQRHGYTPLHGAAQNGADVLVERLLAAGADPARTTDDGRTAADIASSAGHEELASRLR